jgi:hypothetical protein
VTILGMDECNIFEQLSRQQYVDVLDCIREVILATDIAAHLRKVVGTNCCFIYLLINFHQ